ncbi:MAG: CotH kinase family protein, partial [Candidatus Fermentibacteraceae bacterium]|nr:CotH kinase family protein [Candidatus Fermentibacteraceae bacterium]
MLLALIALVSAPVWPDTVPAFSLEFDQSQWEYACDHYWQDIYIPAQLSVNGFTYQCQFRIRGATSRVLPKKSIKIELPQGMYLFGQNEFNMNAEYVDVTRIRECLSYLYYSRTGQTVPEVHFTEVVFNGETQGAYLSVQDIDKEFLLHTDLPDEAVIYKCT